MSKKKPAKATPATKNPEMEKRAIRALDATWSAIGGDTLQCVADSEGIPLESVVMKRAEVIDMVTACGFVGGYPAMYGRDEEAIEWLDKQPRKEQDRIVRAAFPFARYGL